MGLTLSKAAFVSHQFRSALNNGGGRTLDFSGIVQSTQQEGGIISTLINWGGAAAGFLWRVAQSILGVFSVAGLAAQFINAVRFAVSFNLGASDAELDNQIKGLWNQFYGRLGGAFGQAAGWFVCGGAVTLATFKFNKALAFRILQEVGEEAFEEMRATLIAMGAATAQATIRSIGIAAFKNIRKWLKQPGNPIYPLLPQGLRDAWEKGKPWSIGQAIERRIEALPDGWEQFVEEFLEEFGDSCSEAIMVAANAADAWLSEQRQKAVAGPLGPEFVIEVQPNRNEPDKYFVSGPLQVIKEAIPTTIQERHYLQDKDLGMQVDEDVRNILLAAQPFSLYGWIVFQSEDRRSPGRRPCYQLPAFDRAKVNDYERVRAACGGANGYLWGRFIALATTSTGHPLTIRGATSDEAKDRLEALAGLCDLEILTLNITEEKRSYKRASNPALQKDAKRVLPWRLKLVNRKYYTDPRPNAQPNRNGSYEDVRYEFDISGPNKPADWDARMSEVLLGPTANNP